MHPIGPELPISAHVACTRVRRQLYVLHVSHALVQATVGVGTVTIVYIFAIIVHVKAHNNCVHWRSLYKGGGSNVVVDTTMQPPIPSKYSPRHASLRKGTSA